MEIDVNLHKPPNAIELKTISAGSYSHGGTSSNHGSSNNNNSHSFNNNHRQLQQQEQHRQAGLLRSVSPTATPPPPGTSGPAVTPGCCGIFSSLLYSSGNNRGKTATSSADFNTIPFNATDSVYGGGITTQQPNPLYANLLKKGQQHRRTPQEIYFESRGKSCKKLLKFNGNSNKILLYPEEGWARTASSSYWTITPCWWQPNRCRIEEFAGTQRRVTKAKMVSLEQKGSLLIVGHFRSKDSSSSSAASNSGALSTYSTTSSTSSSGRSPSTAAAAASAHSKDNDEFKLYLSSNISMEDYNMGYCLTGFVERRCQQTNTFQMTHFAVIKRQWPSLIHTQTQPSKASRVFCTSGSSSSGGGCGGSGGGGSKRRDTSAKPT
ncbi:uncharacterized protein LOC133335616 [Musca vetustissima]|uniref:uncharacterized protein LOC133335616 n=1 Tax=Musca vetustissima TaxID=27455 RepID=UPI002AB75030|nr:uncharacterized protein LOC133335616 [Musca vetustissima]